MPYNFDAAVPGQSLTMPPGGMAMERPVQFTDPREAAEFLFQKLTEPKKVIELSLMLKKGTPIEYIVRAILFEGIIKGNWTVDVAMLIGQVAMWQVESIAKLKGIKYKFKNDDQQHEEFISQFLDLLNDKPVAEEPVKTSMFKGLM